MEFRTRVLRPCASRIVGPVVAAALAILACAPAREHASATGVAQTDAEGCSVGTGPGAADTLVLYGLGPGASVPPPDAGGPYAAARQWFLANAAVTIGGRRYARFGWPLGARRPGPDSRPVLAVRFGEHDGVPVYAVPPLDPYPRLVLVQLSPACEFQPYAEASELR